MAIKSNGSLWGWGFNSSGQLGDGTFSNRLSPVWIMDDVAEITTGNSHTSMAVKTDGSIWGWGDNRLGALGTGTITNQNTPILIAESNSHPIIHNVPTQQGLSLDIDLFEITEHGLEPRLHIYNAESLILPDTEMSHN